MCLFQCDKVKSAEKFILEYFKEEKYAGEIFSNTIIDKFVRIAISISYNYCNSVDLNREICKIELIKQKEIILKNKIFTFLQNKTIGQIYKNYPLKLENLWNDRVYNSFNENIPENEKECFVLDIAIILFIRRIYNK